MSKEIVELTEDVSSSPLYSEDLAPVPASKRTWNLWNITAIWVGMAVCIPTYILASYMIKSGLPWYAALMIIFLANLIITIPMALNGHAGVKYGVPFPVLGRSSFGTAGVHFPSIVRGIVACGWFGIQTWIGGLAFYAIWCAVVGDTPAQGLSFGKFVGFALFWLVNIYFIWSGTESIKWLETYSAPILILMGLLLVGWGATQGGGFSTVLDQSAQLEKPSASLAVDEAAPGKYSIALTPIKDLEGRFKAKEFQVSVPTTQRATPYVALGWQALTPETASFALPATNHLDSKAIADGSKPIKVQYRSPTSTSSVVDLSPSSAGPSGLGKLWSYILWLTAMVGFWATMSISIADITRYAHNQKEQIAGQFLGLPGTMLLYSFVGIFVTAAAVLIFPEVLIGNDAPWDPVTLLGKFKSPAVVIIAQIFMIIATLSTNIAANVIAPANAFSNALPKQLSFRAGGVVTGIIGIIICPWWIMDEISGLLIFVSGLLGPVLAVLLCDYYVVRKRELNLAAMYKTDGAYSFGGSGFNSAAMISLAVGVASALIGYFVPALDFLFKLSWFIGFGISFVVYWALMRGGHDVAHS